MDQEHIVDKFVDKEIRRTILQPRRTEIDTHEILQHVPIREDVIVEKKVEKVITKIV